MKQESPQIDRRRFVVLMAAAGAAVLALGVPRKARARERKTEALLLSCMDYRLIDETERYMAGRGLRDRYDHIVLAGASLGAVTSRYPAWNTTFWEHLEVAIQLHHVETVIVLDHRDCGAYRVLLGEDLAQDRQKETTAHGVQMRELRRQIEARFPRLRTELLLMSLSGEVEAID